MRISATAALSVLTVTMLGSHAASAQSFEIRNGQTAGLQTMNGAGDTGTVRAGGTIATSSGDAVQMFNSDQSLVNNGSIWTSGDNVFNVNSQGDNALIRNNGWIATTGNGSYGILASGSGARVDNRGRISVSGTADAGIIADGNYLSISNSGLIEAAGVASGGIIWLGTGLRVTNSGSIMVDGTAAGGILAGGDDVVIDNSGLVDVSGDSAIGIGAAFGSAIIDNSGSVVVNGLSVIGIEALGTSASIANSGSVEATGDLAVGIGAAPDGASVTNSGSITTTGFGNVALSTLGDGTTVTNSGRIISNGGDAIYFGGSDATLNLLAGTAIQGPIIFSGGGNTATFGRGLSAAMTFSGSGVPGTIRTDGQPYVISGNTVAVADVTGFTSAGSVIEDLTGGIDGAIQAHLSKQRIRNAEAAALTGWRAWLSPFATGRTQDAHGASAGFSNTLGGMIGGIETDVHAYILVGAFMGAAGGNTEVDHDAQRIDHRSVFGGGYLAYDSGTRFADLSFTAGTLDEESRRHVANNLVLGGIEIASADYDGTFVSPSLTLGTRLPYGAATLEPSLRLRYAGLFLDDYAETGSTGAMSVASRDVHVFTARGQLALAQAPVKTSDGTWQTIWRGGIDGVIQSADDVSATLLGQPISFDATDRETAVRGFIGANLSLVSQNGMTFGGDIELAYGSDDALIARAGARLDIAF